MDEPHSESEPTKPTDADMTWSGWAMDTLREQVGIDMHTKRTISTQQLQTPVGPDMPDFALMQSRLSRSVRLGVAMVERIRADYLLRREKRRESGEEQRRRQRREQAVETAAEAIARPEEHWDADCVRSVVRETLVEDEILDEQIDQLSPEEFLRAVCRKIGRPPPSIPLPQLWADESGGSRPPGTGPGRIAMASRPARSRAELPQPCGAGPSRPALPQPDSS